VKGNANAASAVPLEPSFTTCSQSRMQRILDESLIADKKKLHSCEPVVSLPLALFVKRWTNYAHLPNMHRKSLTCEITVDCFPLED